ncbi:MAG: SH3 domain-containing protein [Synechococcaceae cyanobacterium SM2_3_2]|nr:SH3 domain-containing protein [Synechococcaceae cyanobacterium SM2_3_2]
MYPQLPREVADLPPAQEHPVSLSTQETRVLRYPQSDVARPRPYSTTASFPWGSLMVGSIILGAIAAGSWQVWQVVSPMLEPPLPPEFDQANAPPPLPTVGSGGGNAGDAPPANEEDPAPNQPSVDGTFGPGSRGQVIEPIGLALRSQPSGDGAYLGGVVMGETVTVLELSSDGGWQRVRRELNGQEGWVRSGNLGSTSVPPPAPVTSAAPAATPAPPTPETASSPPPPVAQPTLAPAPVTAGSGQQGRVLVPIGLAVRAAPDSNSAQVGGIPVNEVITVVGESADGDWQRVRTANGMEGWIRAGNLGAP